MVQGTTHTRFSSSLSCICSLNPSTSNKSKILSDGSQESNKRESAMSPVWYCTFSPNGQLIASCHGTPEVCIRIWKLESSTDEKSNFANMRWVLSSTLNGCHERTIRYVAFAPSNTILASASFDGTVGIWEDLSVNNASAMNSSSNFNTDDFNLTWECTAQLEGHDSEVKCVAWNASGTLLATCGRDKSVWVWECLLSMDGGEIGGGGGGDGEFECLAVLHGHNGDVKCVLFIPSNGQWGDGEEILLSASYDDTIKCWAEDGGDWYCAATLSAHSSTVWSISSTPGGARLVSASDDCSLAIWKSYTASEKNQMIAQGQEDHGICSSDGLWKCVGKLESAHQRAIYHVDCAPSCAGHGGIASASSDTCIKIYREIQVAIKYTSDAPLFELDVSLPKAHGEYDINCVKWYPKNGRLLISGGDDGIIRLWNYTSVLRT